MGFSYHARRVRDPARSLWRRRGSLRGCVASLAWLSGQSYRALLASLDERFGIFPPWMPGAQPPDEEALLAALAVVEAERARVLQELERFARRRAGAKARGRRQLSRAEREALAALRRVSLDGPASPTDPA